MTEKTIKLLTHQWEILKLTHKYNLLLGGLGSGKTWTGGPWVLQKCANSPRSLGLITSNTYGQLQKSTLTSLFNFFHDYEIDYKYNKNSSKLSVLGKTFLCLSAENFDAHRGIEVGEWWSDESAYMSEKAFDVFCGRLRDKRGDLNVLLTTTPKGYNWLYKRFHEEGEKYNPQFYKYISAKTSTNIHLPENYESTLLDQFDAKLAAQELYGEFVNIALGRIYYGFDSDKHVKTINYNPNYPVWIGMDFNINPMTATIAQIIGDKVYVFDELYLKNSNTTQAAQVLQTKYPKATIVPDSTGVKHTTNSSKSDHHILREHGFEIKSAANPFRVDRYASVNLSFSKNLLIVDPKCKMLIKDLEQVSYKEGMDTPDVTDKSLTHISDALGYLIWRTINPLRSKLQPVIME